MSSERAELVEELLARSRELSTETVMFHTAIAELNGLSTVESKISDYLARLGPMTPKELARYSGLAPASVTALVDRLEKKGMVRRKPHPDDRRKVLIEFDMTSAEAAAPLWDHLVTSVRKACDRYTADELRLLIEFVATAAAITHESTGKITGPLTG
ncbi:MarR family winged helix-turn-helix transcriptional regulator [Amycolatopsis sp. NPDC059021]|uniref:MarR family winged helix-turn-helix transcriptional regulator n=1 Tax=Amycolatopsis sp. NPDC059021 TaxID=3346704 RepID=UPI003672ED1E